METIIVAAMLWAAVLPGTPAGAADSEQTALERRYDAGNFPGAVKLIVGPDGVRHAAVVGLADRESERPMALDSVFWMASTGKTLTAIAFMILVDEGKAALDDPVARYLPHLKTLYRREILPDGAQKIVAVKEPVTMRHLLSHSAGFDFLPGFFQNKELGYLSLETQSHVYAASPLQFEPGTSFCYSNAGINITGRVIEVISGLPYEEFVRTRIFDPLGMKDSTYRLNADQLTRLVTGYAFDPAAKAWVRCPVIEFMSVLPYDSPDRHAECGGGWFSTPADLARLAQMIANRGVFKGRRLISEASLREICRRQSPPHVERAYGLGSDVGNVGHGGAWGTSLSVDLDKQTGYIWLVQKSGKWPEDIAAETARSGK